MISNFHRQNNVAKELYTLENTFFTGKVKHDTLAGLRPYYAAIKSAAALVTSHHEKQKFLKTIYENFYKVYDKKKADRLGVIYTPNEIVRFMVESADWLCQKHFGKALIDKKRGNPRSRRRNGHLHHRTDRAFPWPAAEASAQVSGGIARQRGGDPALLRRQPEHRGDLCRDQRHYEEYPNLCFVDTLDNTAALRVHKGQQGDLFGAVSEENVARIKRQNKRKISVIIGNPPYNANQLNENENNKNREYPEIDRRIKETYIDRIDRAED